MKYIYIPILLIIININIFAQSPEADFSIPSSICLNERISITNNSSNSDTYQWDFCIGDFGLEPILNTQKRAELAAGYGFELVED